MPYKSTPSKGKTVEALAATQQFLKSSEEVGSVAQAIYMESESFGKSLEEEGFHSSRTDAG